MAYKFSQRHQQDKTNTADGSPNQLDLGKIATVFIVFGLIGLLTSGFYSMETGTIAEKTFQPTSTNIAEEVGPIQVKKYSEAYNIKIDTNMQLQTWSFIEGQVLDSQKRYLFSFGKELWHEQGHDSDGYWREMEGSYNIHVTFPQPGVYYLKFVSQGNKAPQRLSVKVAKKRGSSLPHLWFGIICLLVGLVLNEMRNRTFRKLLRHFDNE